MHYNGVLGRWYLLQLQKFPEYYEYYEAMLHAYMQNSLRTAPMSAGVLVKLGCMRSGALNVRLMKVDKCEHNAPYVQYQYTLSVSVFITGTWSSSPSLGAKLYIW
jgi:hypothetical protein